MNKLTDISPFKEELEPFKLSAFIGDHVAYLREYFKNNKTKDYMPMVIFTAVRRGTMEVERVAIGIASLGEDRHEMMWKLGLQLSATHIPIHALMVNEGWMSTLKKGETPSVRPSEDPARIEVLSLGLVTVELKSIGCMYKIARDAEDNMDLGECVTTGEDYKMEGLLLREFIKGALYGFLKGFTPEA